ncbi:MAG: IS1634 family transposase [Hyphomicrobiaceae bacterium]|nr:IS1634 family transposase [Hyphomicrobiaceae bacterium]
MRESWCLCVMHIDTIPNRNSRPAYLLRESVREGKRVRKRTLANLSSLTIEQIEAIRRVLKGERLGPVEDGLEVVRSRAHGHVEAVLTAMRRLGFEKLIDPKASGERDLVVAMVAERIIAPEASKLGMTRAWVDTTLCDELGVADADEDALYAAMDWLAERQEAIEKRLARRHLKDGGLVLFDLTSSYFEGVTCPLAKIGYSRDGKRGTLQVNYGLMTDARGCPVSVSVFEGNTADPKTLLPQIEKVRTSFGLDRLVMAGDRGMISNIQIEALRKLDGVDWITALKSGAIAKLATGGRLQLDLFDERNLISFTHEDYPGERLIACRNPALARLSAEKRRNLIAATTGELEKVAAMVAGGRLKGAGRIGVRAGKVVDKYKVAKHFDLTISDSSLTFKVNEESIAAEAALDGLYVIRTSVAEVDMTCEQAVLNYKRLAEVERAFRTLKGIDLQVRPIRHRLEARVKAHIFLSMLAYYVQWHMMEAWRRLTFADEAGEDAARLADPVAPARRSKAALAKVRTRMLADGTPAMSFTRLLTHLATIVRNTLRPRSARTGEATFTLTTRPSAKQQQALDLIAAITV